MEILCPVSVGELLDKISILRIKRRRIKDPAKLTHVERELDQLTRAATILGAYEELVAQLQKVNEELWEVEDAIRVKERGQQFDARFIELARSVYRTNDRRFAIKDAINRRYHSGIVEEKSYEAY